MSTRNKAGAAGQAAAWPAEARQGAAWPAEARQGAGQVVRLSCADGPKIEQQGRRGRHPKCVTPLWRVRMELSGELAVIRLQAKLEHVLQALDELGREGTEADRERLRLDRRISAIDAAYAELSSQRDRLKAELRALGLDGAGGR